MADIKPNDIINKEFRMALRGYATDQVDTFLQEISDSMFRVMEENQRLHVQADDFRNRLQQYLQTEDLMKNALILAERAAEETRQRAHQEADLIRREAELQIASDRAALEELRQLRGRIIAELRAMIQTHASLLDSQEERRTGLPRNEQGLEKP